jgi:hypothetical protein
MNTREILRDVRVASPCKADWTAMQGDEKKRFCLICRKHVHNFSAMTEAEILELYRQQGSDICIRFFVRQDGTMIVGDCPVGVRRKKRSRLAAAVVGIAGLLLLGGTAAGHASYSDRTLQDILESNPVTARILEFLGLSRPVMMGLSGKAPFPIPPDHGADTQSRGDIAERPNDSAV